MKSARFVPALLLALTIVGMSTPAAPHAQVPQQAAPAMEGYPAVGAPPTVKLVSPGAEPRKALRYSIPAGQKSSADMTMNMSMAMSVGGMSMPMDLPGMKMTMALSVTNVAPSGDITYDVAFTGMTFDETAGANPAIAAALQPMQASITSLKGTATVSNRGVTKSTNFTNADPSVQQLMGQMTSSAENLSNPFPEEAIGVGAKWEVRAATSAGGQTIFQKTVYEVVSINGSTVALKVTTEQTAPPQSVSNPSLPAGAEVYLDKMAGSGEGTVTIKLDSLVPTSEMTMTSSMAMTVNLGGQSQAMNSDNKIKITIAPGR